jgi:serine/threonine-protein kinase
MRRLAGACAVAGKQGRIAMHALDRPLLSGLLALERQFVTAEELIGAFQIWRSQPADSLGHILVTQGKLSIERVESLEKIIGDSTLLRTRFSAGDSNGSPTTTWQPDSTSVANGLEVSLRPASLPNEVAVASGQEGASARFKPIRLHARGGLGHVYLADDLELHRQVALKEIRWDAADDPASRERFLAEAKITGNLEHPGIVPVYGLGVHADGRPFYAMRFIQGQTLSEAIKKFHKDEQQDFASLEFRQLLGRLVSVCNAVAFAHSRGIVHRDLKPSNVMLGPFGETLVVDWGLAKPFKPSEEETTLQWKSNWPSPKMPPDSHYETCEGEIVGTPAYMSPEQAEGHSDDVGPVSDVYGVGAVLYALLTGQSPLGGSSSDIVEAVKQGNIVPPRQLNPRVPRSLAAICQKAMAHQPLDRYPSALDLAADIERWLADEPVVAYREPWTDRGLRWVRKHRLPASVGGVVLLLTAVALAVGYVLVRNERDIANRERTSAVAANERAQKNAAATRQVIEQFLIQIGDDRWAEIPGSEEARLEMVNLATKRYRELVAREPHDPSLWQDAVTAFRRCANLYRMLRQYSKAESLYDEALTLTKNDIELRPSQNADQRLLCEIMIERALLALRLNGSMAGKKLLDEALRESRRMQASQPNIPEAAFIASRAQANLAVVLADIGDRNNAVALAQAAAANFKRLAAANASPQSARLTDVLSGLNLADILRESGRLVEATKVLEETLQRGKAYTTLAPQNPNLRQLMASGQWRRAQLFAADVAQLEAARGEIVAAVQALDDLVQQFPRTVSFRRTLAEMLTTQAQIDLQGAKHEDGARAARRAVELLEQLDLEDGSPAEFQPLLAEAYTVVAEIAAAHGNEASAKQNAEHALQRLAIARTQNPDGPRLVDLGNRLTALGATP